MILTLYLILKYNLNYEYLRNHLIYLVTEKVTEKELI